MRLQVAVSCRSAFGCALGASQIERANHAQAARLDHAGQRAKALEGGANRAALTAACASTSSSLNTRKTSRASAAPSGLPQKVWP